METIPPLSTNQPEINELVRIYAKDKGISENAAWSALTKVWIPKAQIYDIYGLPSQQQLQPQQPNVTTELMVGKQNVTLQKLELDFKTRQLEYQERLEAREAQKLELEKEKIKNDKEVALAKLELEKTIADRKAEQESRRIESKEDFEAKLLLIQAGKKPEDAVEKFYERLFEEKKGQDAQLDKLRKEHSEQLQKLENSIKNKSSPEDIFEQLEKLKKVEKGMMETTLASLEAYGVDTKVLRKVAKLDEKSPDGTAGMVWEVGKKIWKDYVEPNIDKAQRELSPPLQQQQQGGPTPNQIEQQREYQNRLAAEQDRIKTEFIRKQEENAKLHAQLEQEKQIHDQRQQLEDKAVQLGIAVNPTLTDRQISDLIVRQEFIFEQGRIQREKLDAHAISIGISPDPSLTNEQMFDIIEHREAEIEQRNRAEIERQSHQHHRVQETVDAVITAKPNEIPEMVKQLTNSIVKTKPEVNQIASAVPPLIQAQAQKPEPLQADIQEELTKPPEISKETEEFLSGHGGQVGGQAGENFQVTENIKDAAVEPQDNKARKTKSRKKDSQDKDKQEKAEKPKKQPSTYRVIRGDGEPIDVEAKNPHGAAMKAARIIGAKEDSPVTIKISGGDLDKEQSYEVAMKSNERDGKTIQIAKANRVQGT